MIINSPNPFRREGICTGNESFFLYYCLPLGLERVKEKFPALVKAKRLGYDTIYTMNLSPEFRLAVVMDTDRSINRYRVGFFLMVVPFGIRWHGVIHSSVSVGAAFGVMLAWISLLPVFVFVETNGSNAGGRRKGSFFIACLRWKTGKNRGRRAIEKQRLHRCHD